uniref:RRM domain-containing protein n=1 Tax=Ceratitis capitata TaxID=7213 RepID=W8C2E2_CERCA
MDFYFEKQRKQAESIICDQEHQPLIQYTKSPFEFPSPNYQSYQENGTKYLKCLKVIPEPLQKQLHACAGEIFLSGIPPEIRAEAIAEVAALIGELYILRFKVNFSGDSRGFAYLQYLNPTLMQLAIIRLPALFRQHSLPMIRVRQSRNSSKLLLKKTYRMSPQSVYELLCKLINFDKLVGRELYPGYFEYQIIFKCNEEAVHARRELLRTISKFGRNAVVLWDTSNEGTDVLSDECNANAANRCGASDFNQESFPTSHEKGFADFGKSVNIKTEDSQKIYN